MQGDNTPARAICGAKTRSGGECQNAPMENGRCRMHGGLTPAGIASPHGKHLRYSKYMSGELGKRAQEVANDSELLEMGAERRVLHARLTQLIENAEDLIQSEAWGTRVQRLFEQYRRAHREGKLDVKFARERELFDELEAGPKEYEVWGEVRATIEEIRRLNESEIKRLEKANRMVPADEVYAWLRQIGAALRDEFGAEHMGRIQAALNRIGSRIPQQ